MTNYHLELAYESGTVHEINAMLALESYVEAEEAYAKGWGY